MNIREKPYNLQILEKLNARLTLDSSVKKYYINLSSSFKSECQFDQMFKATPFHTLPSFSLNQDFERSFQIDLLVFTANCIYLYELKNLQSPTQVSGNLFITAKGTQYENPLIQLNRTDANFKKLLEKENINMPVKSYLVFTHPNFYLYNADINNPYIFAGQIPSHIQNLIQSQRPVDIKAKNMALSLASLSFDNSRSDRNLPIYSINDLAKGSLVCYAII